MTARLAPCPLCSSSEVHTFSHYTWDNGIQEVVKVMCADCQCEAPLTEWNNRDRAKPN